MGRLFDVSSRSLRTLYQCPPSGEKIREKWNQFGTIWLNSNAKVKYTVLVRGNGNTDGYNQEQEEMRQKKNQKMTKKCA